jgi:hypothetical protein
MVIFVTSNMNLAVRLFSSAAGYVLRYARTITGSDPTFSDYAHLCARRVRVATRFGQPVA